MAAPTNFIDLSAEERRDILIRRREVTLHVPLDIAAIGDLGSAPVAVDLPTHREVPPTPAILSKEGIIALYTKTAGDAKGAWLQFLAGVYGNRGQILYRQVDEQTLEAVVRFARRPAMGDRVEMADGTWWVQYATDTMADLCQQRMCMPASFGHTHRQVNVGLLIWHPDEAVFRLIGDRGPSGT